MIQGFEFHIVRADRRRIETLRVTPPTPGAADNADADVAGAAPDSG